MHFGKSTLLLVLAIATCQSGIVQGKKHAFSPQGQGQVVGQVTSSFVSRQRATTTKQQQHDGTSSRQLSSRGGSSSGGTATVSTEIFNLIKSIVGAGVLSLPAGTFVQ
jgi:hypothetical protein